ncbi:hypothetical protein POTOM_047068 [Populus tomentosa]|uniref:Protein kinase domain-containing protein n=1 Tax=Populus tomentosa TaxID=118781 RepID=A0A8X8CD39_POPTO|nr:hypothetical protein POTOM_047068 [Populus tomentosa]
METETENDEYGRQERIALVAIVVVASLTVASLLVAFSYYCYIRNKLSKRLKNHSREGYEDKGCFTDLEVVAGKGLNVFTFKQLHSATGGFSKSNVVGHGGFGLVYRGVLSDGRKVAIKLMDQAGKQGEDEFKVETCIRIMLVERAGSNTVSISLDWETRLRIALEAAKGLEYLHEHVNPPVIHRDFKSSNILLDRNLHAKVSDFGLAKLGPDKAGGHVSTRVLGTQGYIAPEYALTGHLTTKSDVYSYGVVLLELLTGRVPVDIKRPAGEGVLALPWLTDREKVVEIMDPALEGQYSMKEVIQVAAIAAMCVQPEADYRPLMADVVQVKCKVTSKYAAALLDDLDRFPSYSQSSGFYRKTLKDEMDIICYTDKTIINTIRVHVL